MAIRVSKLLRDLNIGLDTLEKILIALDYKETPLDLNTKIPDNIVNLVMGCFSSDAYKDMHLLGGSQNKLTDMSPLQYDDKQSFWINELVVLSSEERDDCIKIGTFDETEGLPHYSVIIGTNGVGKSTLMKEMVDFFIDLRACVTESEQRTTSVNKGRLKRIRYYIDGLECEVTRLGKSFIAKIDGQFRKLSDLRIPSIVACHFGAFDKFPTQKVNGSLQTRYDVPYYKYIGAHVNGNMISSSAIAFRLLFALSEQMDDRQRRNICSILDLIGYDHRISLSYSFVLKSRKDGAVRDVITQRVEKDKEYKIYSKKEKNEIVSKLYVFYKNKTDSGKTQFDYNVDFDRDSTSKGSFDELNYIYKLKQCDLINSVNVLFHKQGCKVTSDEMSSGEFAMLSTVLSVSAAVNDVHTLVLIDEPELSLHPNWQMSLIDNLDRALVGKTCHLLIATHSHMLVSDLPMQRSIVVQIEKDEVGNLNSTIISECTYGWSAEEVLLKVFKTATDRNKYLAEIVGTLLRKIGDNSITTEEVRTQVGFLRSVSDNLSDVDPMKKIIFTIIDGFSR